MEEFDNTYEDYNFESDENKIDPIKILAEVNKPSEKVTKIDYHKRTVLAAEIVHKLSNRIYFRSFKTSEINVSMSTYDKYEYSYKFFKTSNGSI